MMPKVKFVAVIILVLMMAFPPGNANIVHAEDSAEAPVQTMEEPAPETTPSPSTEPTPEPSVTPEPTPAPTPEPTVTLEPTPEPTAMPEPVTQTSEAAPPPEPAVLAAAETTAVPEPDPGVLVLPDIPAGAPSPSQIKRLPDSGMVCLTFDDGYNKAAIETILACLRDNDVQCTFFVIGACLKNYPALWRQAAEDGHEIAYHTMTHHSLNGYSNAKIVADINKWNETAHSILGVGYRIPKIARAPGGSANTRVRRLFNCLGYKLIYWSSDTYTGVYRRSKSNAGTRIARYIIKKTVAGSISLQHFNKYDAASVSRYIVELKAKFRLGTVSEALAAGG